MKAIIGVILVGLLIWLAISLGGALTNPAYGSSMSARFAEWARQNGGGSIVNKVENYWYSHHAPKVGGSVPNGAIKTPITTPTTVAAGPPHLPAPVAMAPFATPALAGEGQWSPAGRLVDGVPAVYTTELRPDAVHTSYVVGVAWMDTKLLHATLYSGSQIPGGGPFTHTAPVQATAANSLVSAFNAGFLSGQSNGGYFTDGKTLTAAAVGGGLRGDLQRRDHDGGRLGAGCHPHPQRRRRPPEPRPHRGRGPTGSRAERRRHHPVGQHAGRGRLCLPIRPGRDGQPVLWSTSAARA